jgi:hypothetical protein
MWLMGSQTGLQLHFCWAMSAVVPEIVRRDGAHAAVGVQAFLAHRLIATSRWRSWPVPHLADPDDEGTAQQSITGIIPRVWVVS